MAPTRSRIAVRGGEPAPRGLARVTAGRDPISSPAPRTRAAEAPASSRAVELDAKRLEARCEALLAELADAEQSRAEMLSLLSHELRNPLTVVLMSGRLLSRAFSAATSPGAIDAAARSNLNRLLRGAEELNQMLADFSDANRIETGRLLIDSDANDVATMVDEALDAVRLHAEARGVELRRDLGRGLPRVQGDRPRLVRTLGNLLANALKFTPRNGAIVVRVSLEEAPPARTKRAANGARGGAERHEIHISVSDTGPGLPADSLPHMFELATGRGRRKAVTQGVGVGLYVAKGVVEAHGGRIWVESEMGHGTTVHLTIPQGVEADVQPRA